MVAAERGGADANAALQIFRAQVRTPFPGGDNDVNFEIVGAQPHPLGAIKAHRTQVGAGEMIGADRQPTRLINFILAVRHRHPNNVGGTEQPVGMGLKPENGCAPVGSVSANALEDAHAIVQGVGQDMGVGFAPRR